jgi:hypothetical protein
MKLRKLPGSALPGSVAPPATHLRIEAIFRSEEGTTFIISTWLLPGLHFYVVVLTAPGHQFKVHLR